MKNSRDVNSPVKARVFGIPRAHAPVLLGCIVLFVAALIRYHVGYDPTDAVPIGQESLHLARNLATKGQFANPFRVLDTGPSAHLAPAFPALLAFLMRFFGENSVGIYAIKLTAALLLSLQLALFPVFSKALGMGELNGFIAASIWIIARVGAYFTPERPPVAMFAWENLSAGLLMAVALCCFRRCLDSPPGESNIQTWLLGASLGVLGLTSPTAGIVFICCLAWLARTDRLDVFRLRYVAVALLPALIIAPWIIRNYLVFDRIVLVRDNLGLELSVSNNDCTTLMTDFECFAKLHPNASVSEAEKVVAYGEPKYNDLKFEEALLWIKTHPSRFMKLCAVRAAAFWMPPAARGRGLERIVVCGLTLLSAAGLWMVYQRDRRSAVACMLCLGLFPLMYYFIQYQYRYRYPILWLTFLLGAFPITTCVQSAYRSIFEPVPSARADGDPVERTETSAMT